MKLWSKLNCWQALLKPFPDLTTKALGRAVEYYCHIGIVGQECRYNTKYMAFKPMGVMVAGSRLAASKKDYATGTDLHELIQVRAKKDEMVFFCHCSIRMGIFLIRINVFRIIQGIHLSQEIITMLNFMKKCFSVGKRNISQWSLIIMISKEDVKQQNIKSR